MFEFKGTHGFTEWSSFKAGIIENDFLFIKGYNKKEQTPLTLNKYGLGITGITDEVDLDEKLIIEFKNKISRVEFHMNSEDQDKMQHSIYNWCLSWLCYYKCSGDNPGVGV